MRTLKFAISATMAIILTLFQAANVLAQILPSLPPPSVPNVPDGAFWTWPAQGLLISQGYNDFNTNNMLNDHPALDLVIVSNQGFHAIAMCDGEIESIVELNNTRSVSKGVSLMTKCQTTPLIEFRFIHINANSLSVREGQKINQGDIVGIADGSGGISSGPHLHLEVYVDHALVDPIRYLINGEIVPYSGRVFSNKTWIDPVKCPVTGWYFQLYGQYNKNETNHTGKDYGCSIGTEIHSPSDGVVYKEPTNWFDYGNDLWIRYGNDQSDQQVFCMFAHIERWVVTQGQAVIKGQLIGYTGQSGYFTTGPVLHFGCANKAPEEFGYFYEHSITAVDKRGWIDPDQFIIGYASTELSDSDKILINNSISKTVEYPEFDLVSVSDTSSKKNPLHDKPTTLNLISEYPDYYPDKSRLILILLLLSLASVIIWFAYPKQRWIAFSVLMLSGGMVYLLVETGTEVIKIAYAIDNAPRQMIAGGDDFVVDTVYDTITPTVRIPSSQSDTANCTVLQKYPLEIQKWCSIIIASANENNIDPALIAAVIWQESGGNPNASSTSGAQGLMQIMPRDGIAAGFMCQNGPCFASRPSTQELLDPEFNVKWGTAFLAGLKNQYGSDIEALFRYGPMDVGYYYADKVMGIYESHR